jgi:hypothetical protein
MTVRFGSGRAISARRSKTWRRRQVQPGAQFAMFDFVGRHGRQNPAAVRLHRTANEQWKIVRAFDRRLEADGFGRTNLGRTIDDEPEGALGGMLAEQDHRSREIRIDELRHGQEQCRSQRHRSSVAR